MGTGSTVLLLLMMTLAQALPPLSESQQTRLVSATDGSALLDEAAMFPLLENVGQWQASDEAIVTEIADIAALRNEPAQHRGDTFIIRGRLASGPLLVGRLARPGPWEGKLQQWFIKTGPENRDIAVVYLTEPPSQRDRPRVGEPVQAVARFYKIWQQPRREDGEPALFVTFVGRTVAFDPTGVPEAEPISQQTLLKWGVSVGLAGMALVWTIARWRARQIASESARHRDVHVDESLAGQRKGDDLAGTPLPSDPAEALDAMQRRNDELG
jgi:hypothetical protein